MGEVGRPRIWSYNQPTIKEPSALILDSQMGLPVKPWKPSFPECEAKGSRFRKVFGGQPQAGASSRQRSQVTKVAVPLRRLRMCDMYDLHICFWLLLCSNPSFARLLSLCCAGAGFLEGACKRLHEYDFCWPCHAILSFFRADSLTKSVAITPTATPQSRANF